MATVKTDKKQPQDNKLDTGKNGYQDIGAKSSGVKQRGAGAATKGITARGPMG